MCVSQCHSYVASFLLLLLSFFFFFFKIKYYLNYRKLRIQHLDLSNCTVETSVLEDILLHCRHLQNLSLEGLVLSDSIIQ